MSARTLKETQALIKRNVSISRPGGCWVWTGNRDGGGYGVLYWGPNGRKYKGAHRVSYAAFVADPGALHVCHGCDNPSCVNPAHLWLGTPSQNHRDKVAKGRANTPKGERTGARKLCEDDVRIIRQRIAAGDLQRVIADDFGVTPPVISYINTGKAWGHVK